MLYELGNFCALNSIRWDRANPREMFFSRCLFWFFFRQRKKEQENLFHYKDMKKVEIEAENQKYHPELRLSSRLRLKEGEKEK